MSDAIDDFANHNVGRTSPAQNLFLITPDDDNDLPHVTRAICFAAAGTIKVTTAGGDTVIIPEGALAAGGLHSLAIRRLWATDTSATDIVGVY